MATIVKVSEFNGNQDKNGLMPVYLQPIKGSVPQNAKVVSGTIASNIELEVNGIYLVEISFAGNDSQYGDQWQISNMGSIASPDVKTLLDYSLVDFDPPKKSAASTANQDVSPNAVDQQQPAQNQQPAQMPDA